MQVQRQRKHLINFRVTPEEKQFLAQFVEAGAARNISELIREIVFNELSVRSLRPDGFGNSMHQLVRKIVQEELARGSKTAPEVVTRNCA